MCNQHYTTTVISVLCSPFNGSLIHALFIQARRDTVIAEIKWFYRVTELPEAVYLLLMEDRKNGRHLELVIDLECSESYSFLLLDALFTDPKARERELFMAFNPDTHPASLLR